ncbi:Rieske (2Fe-2S) protein [Rhodococcoides kyotonense]|uniref:Cytochrome bc1 complex Rieske iron-sulfur subunit n=1 Tax=Rhodococcoides kyotonense TaxID=398843 RepID=A0A239LT06_9NOCA|nr:Rieske (2Fe-2S) protein [Rhodococcus kyotonensis]SNT33666.1 Rieske Fe-S protein [Rhodococcus kyotonensis]
MNTMNSLDRRTILRGSVVAATGAAAAVTLAACGGGDSSSVAETSTKAAGIGGAVPTEAADGPVSLGSAADVAVGGGVIFKDQEVVVTQPTSGSYKAFSSVCTHQGCAISSIEDGAMICPCHNSKFSLTDGSVLQGPATEPLPEKVVTVSGGAISLG